MCVCVCVCIYIYIYRQIVSSVHEEQRTNQRSRNLVHEQTDVLTSWASWTTLHKQIINIHININIDINISSIYIYRQIDSKHPSWRAAYESAFTKLRPRSVHEPFVKRSSHTVLVYSKHPLGHPLAYSIQPLISESTIWKEWAQPLCASNVWRACSDEDEPRFGDWRRPLWILMFGLNMWELTVVSGCVRARLIYYSESGVCPFDSAGHWQVWELTAQSAKHRSDLWPRWP